MYAAAVYLIILSENIFLIKYMSCLLRVMSGNKSVTVCVENECHLSNVLTASSTEGLSLEATETLFELQQLKHTMNLLDVREEAA